VAYLSECVLSVIELNPVRVVERVYRTAGSIFYSWKFKDKKAVELQPDLASVFQILKQGKLLLKLEDGTSPKETYERFCVKKTKTDTLTTKAFEFKHRYVSRNPSVLYHVVLPEFCYCDEKTIPMEQNILSATLGNDKRQSVTWVNIEHEARREFYLRFLFYGPNEVEFRKRQKRTTKGLDIPSESKMKFKEISTLASLATFSPGK
jgi:hypothetical protein